MFAAAAAAAVAQFGAGQLDSGTKGHSLSRRESGEEEGDFFRKSFLFIVQSELAITEKLVKHRNFRYNEYSRVLI